MQTKQRDMNFELLRIISMLFIIALHYISHSGLEQRLESYSFNWVFIDFVKEISIIAVNLYVLITGYYMIKSNITVKKVVYIWTLTVFYSILLLIFSIILGRKLGIVAVIKAFLPFSSGIYWFVTAYIALYILLPFINKFLLSLSKKQYQLLLFILLLMIVVVKSIFPDNIYIEPSTKGNHLSWLIYVYMLGSYIRLWYDRKVMKKNICLLIPFLIALFVAIIRLISGKYFGISINRLLSAVNIFNFISMVCMFLYFRELQIKNVKVNYIISKISSTTFAVYLIHNNPSFRPLLWRKVMGTFSFINSPSLLIHFFITI